MLVGTQPTSPHRIDSSKYFILRNFNANFINKKNDGRVLCLVVNLILDQLVPISFHRSVDVSGGNGGNQRCVSLFFSSMMAKYHAIFGN